MRTIDLSKIVSNYNVCKFEEKNNLPQTAEVLKTITRVVSVTNDVILNDLITSC